MQRSHDTICTLKGSDVQRDKFTVEVVNPLVRSSSVLVHLMIRLTTIQ
jgi:hypothetical protein